MAKNRKGLGKNQGQGFKNILPGLDSRTHSNSAKGIKQPQKVNVDALLRQSQAKGMQTKTQEELQAEGQFVDVSTVVEPKTKKEDDLEKLGAETKTGAFVKRAEEKAKEGLAFARKQLKARQDRKAMEKIKLLEEINHPVTRKLTKQQERVAELKTQIALNEDESRENRLFEELRLEEDQLREVQEKVTELQLEELNDSELKTMAIRYKDRGAGGFISDFVGIGSGNPYQDELVRRVKKKQEVERQVVEARKEAKGQSSRSDPVGDFVGDFFS